MRYLGAVLGFILYASASTYTQAHDWTTAAKLLERASVRVTFDEPGKCTGFVINKEKKHVLSAGHCSPKPQTSIYIDGAPSGIVYRDAEDEDLLVLYVSGLDPKKEQLLLADKDPEIQETVLSGGFGFSTWQARRANVSNPAGEWEGLKGKFVSIDAAFIAGQSGGPVINAKGEVVSIVQLGGPGLGLGRGAEYIKDKVGRWFAKEAAKP